MKIRTLLFTVCMILPMAVYSQNLLKEIGKTIATISRTTGEASIHTVEFSNNTQSASSEESYETGYVGEVPSRREGLTFKITPIHPDLKIYIKRCEVSGKTAVIDMIWENRGDKDVKIWFDFHSSKQVLMDDEGNQYKVSCYSYAGGDMMDFKSQQVLYSEVPTKVRFQIEDVAEAATMFCRFDIIVSVDAWNINYNKPIIIKNLPIYRDGE